MRCRTILLACVLLTAPAVGAEHPSRFGIDAPELAQQGAFAVGLRTMQLVEANQVDVLTFDASTRHASRRDRRLRVDLLYPARAPKDAPHVVYTASLPSEPPAPPVRFSVLGMAIRDAAPAGTDLPWVIVSHGYSNDPAAMIWLTEHLASHGYVVAAIHHDDPPITDGAKRAEPILRRPLDIAFVARAVPALLAAERLIDPTRLALIGYSMGGYGVLTAVGAGLDPNGPPTQVVPGGLLLPYVRGGPEESATLVSEMRAVVAIAPAGGGTLAAWGARGMLGIAKPLLLISGDSDRTVDYESGARSFFDTAINAERYLLTFKGAGHAIGLGPTPAAMRDRLWDQDWFEDPVWRKERLNAVEAHFITAFLGFYLKDDASLAAYLKVPVSDSAAGVWPATVPLPAYAAFSPGGSGVTVWKGFQRNHAAGLELLHSPPAHP